MLCSHGEVLFFSFTTSVTLKYPNREKATFGPNALEPRAPEFSFELLMSVCTQMWYSVQKVLNWTQAHGFTLI